MRKLKIAFSSIIAFCVLGGPIVGLSRKQEEGAPAVVNTQAITNNGDNSGISQQDGGDIENNIIQKLGVDPRDIESLLKAFPITLSQGEIREIIDQWHQEKTITADEKKALYVVIRIIDEHSRALSNEIARLREEGSNDLAQFLEKIRYYFQKRQPERIVAEYEKRTKQQKEENVKALNQAIEATTALFALKETRYLYDKLISLEPSAEHYFRFAVFLSTFDIFDDANRNYQKALELYSSLADSQSEAYKAYVAMTLNNLALLHVRTNHLDAAEFEYQEALRIRRKLAENDPEAYGIVLANTLITQGYHLFLPAERVDEAMANFTEAKSYLESQRHIPRAQVLLKILDQIMASR